MCEFNKIKRLLQNYCDSLTSFIISSFLGENNRFIKNKIIFIFNKIVDIVENLMYNIDKEKELKEVLI